VDTRRVSDSPAELEALAARLQSAAERLKAAGRPAAGDPPARAPDPEGIPGAVERLEAAGHAVRVARARLAELEARLAGR
jgi:hypothetical protein